MKYTQLVKPNLATKGRAGWCLNYARTVFGAPPRYPTAWLGWKGTKYGHPNSLFPKADVPVWFDYRKGGVRFGHVAVRLSTGKIWSSPYQKGTTHAVLNSIAEVEKHYGVKFVGWSEDINGKRVVKPEGEDMYKGKDAKYWGEKYEKLHSLAVQYKAQRDALRVTVKNIKDKIISFVKGA